MSSLEQIIEYYYDKPVEFAEDLLGATLSEQQKELLRAIAKDVKVTCRSGHQIGKTAVMAILIVWFQCTRYCPKIICTAPSFSQLHDVLWSEVAKWLKELPPVFREQFTMLKDRLMHKDYTKEWFTVARTAKKENPEAMQGFYSDHLMFIIDEAAGVPNEIFDAIQGSLQGKEVYCVMVGNPRLLSGFFYDSFHDDSERWYQLAFNAEDSPFCDKDWQELQKHRYGVDSIEYRVKVLGEFPLSEHDTLIPSNFVKDAVERENVPAKGTIVWGLDPARFGKDETALAKRQGRVIKEIKTLKGKTDATQVVGWVVNEIRQTPIRERPKYVYVDSIGLGGPIADFLREKNAKFLKKTKFVDVTVSNVSKKPSKYKSLRDELWCTYRDWLMDDEPSLPDDKLLLSQTSTIHYKFHSSGSLVIESKEQMRSRGVRSPDRADAACLTFQPERKYDIFKIRI